jgi:CRP-like cAMP-binding protein
MGDLMPTIQTLTDTLSPSDLRLAEIFREHEDEELSQLCQWFVELKLPADCYLIQEGERSDAFYVIREGTVAVFRDVVGDPVQLLAHLHRGDFFGEMGLFGIGEQQASVRTTVPCRVLKITRRDLLGFLDEHPKIRRKLLAAASYRYTANMAASLELVRRREVRIRFNYPVLLHLQDDTTENATLQNLSLGGLSLQGAPDEWSKGSAVQFGLGLANGVLQLVGRISWRSGDRIGIIFEKTHPNHNMLIQLTIRMLLEQT